MFLLRSAFWLSVVILLIPADPETGEAPRVSVVNAFMAVRATVADLSGFCDRNPDVCVTGGAAIDIFAEKAGNGVEMIYRYIDGDGSEAADPTDSEGRRGTLTTEDLALPWQGETASDDSV
ncbi:MAG TPA: DUF5330 domain-containing protein [Bauldia sp.]|nr:DUF5330 domain-containing protein [Bauldia sp.]